MALNKKIDEKNSEVILLIETYVKGENLQPRLNSKTVNLTMYELAEFSNMQKIDRVATLFVLLDKKMVSSLFSKFSYEIAIELSFAINKIKNIKKQIATAILEEFYILTHNTKLIKVKGDIFLKELLEKTFDKNQIDNILKKINQRAKNEENIKYLANFDSAKLAEFLLSEHPQIIALILSHLPDVKSAKILSNFPKQLRADILIRIANIKTVSSKIVTNIFKLLENKLIDFEQNFLEIDGENKAIKILGFLEYKNSKELIDSIKMVDLNLALTLNDNMFCFEDIVKLNKNEILALIHKLNKDELATALKGSSDEIKQKFLITMDRKEQKKFYDKMLFLGAVKIKDINIAKSKIVKKVYELKDMN